jgi:hypothetical protein
VQRSLTNPDEHDLAKPLRFASDQLEENLRADRVGDGIDAVLIGKVLAGGVDQRRVCLGVVRRRGLPMPQQVNGNCPTPAAR